MRRFRLALVAVVWLPSIAAHAVNNTVVLSPISDGAGTDQPRDGVFDHFFPSNSVYLDGSSPNAEYRSDLEFSLSSLPAGSTIVSATLQLHAVANIVFGSGGSVGVVALLRAGDGVADIGDLTGGGVAMGPVNVNQGTFPEVDFTYTAALQALVATGEQYAEFTLESNGSEYVLEFGARTHPIVNDRPTLTLVYTVPEPSAWILLLVGALPVGRRAVRAGYASGKI